MSDWRGATRAWVEAGWVSEEDRPALEAWLDANRPPSEPSPFVDLALMAGVISGNWLLVGAVVVGVGLLSGHVYPPVWAMLGLGCLQFVAGALFRAIGARTLAQGFLAAWVPVVTFAGLLLIEMPSTAWATPWTALQLVPAGLALCIAVADRMRGLAASAGLAAGFPLCVVAVELPPGNQELLMLGMGLLIALCVVVARFGGERGEVLLSTVPFATAIALGASWVHQPWLPDTVLAWPWVWENGAVSGILGLGLLVGAALARSRLALVSGIATLLYSEAFLLVGVGDFWMGAAVVALEGAVVLGAAMALLLWRTLGARRQAALAAEQRED